MSFFRLLIILLLLLTPTAVAAAVTRDATAVGGKRRGMVGGAEGCQEFNSMCCT